MKNKLFALFLILIALQTIVQGYSILPDTIHSKKHFVKTTKELTFAPNSVIRAFIIKNASITKNNITLEAYHTFKKPQNIKNPITSSDRLSIINILHSISSMQGIKYYSQTRKKLRILFNKSYVVDYPSLKQLNDPVIKHLQQTYTFYTLQEDKTFGKVTYRYTIYQIPEFILLKTENVNHIKYSMMPVVDKRKFKFFLFILDKGEDIALYCLYSIDVIGDKALPLQKVRDSLFNRSDAIVLWFYNRLYGK
ncbi:MAG: hypothetical protein GYA16_10160 [Spirochaetes bacterium]|nr:hypothetical protein [Spirochaetota bacterium]